MYFFSLQTGSRLGLVQASRVWSRTSEANDVRTHFKPTETLTSSCGAAICFEALLVPTIAHIDSPRFKPSKFDLYPLAAYSVSFTWWQCHPKTYIHQNGSNELNHVLHHCETLLLTSCSARQTLSRRVREKSLPSLGQGNLHLDRSWTSLLERADKRLMYIETRLGSKFWKLSLITLAVAVLHCKTIESFSFDLYGSGYLCILFHLFFCTCGALDWRVTAAWFQVMLLLMFLESGELVLK